MPYGRRRRTGRTLKMLPAVATGARAAYGAYRAGRAARAAYRLAHGLGAGRAGAAAAGLAGGAAATGLAYQSTVGVKRRRVGGPAVAQSAQRSGGAEVTRSRGKFGKRKRPTFTKMMQLTVPKRTLRISGVKVQDGPIGTGVTSLQGMYALENNSSGTTSGAFVPIHMVSLNRSIQSVGQDCHHAVSIGASGGMFVNPLEGFASDGTTRTTNIVVESTVGVDSDILRNRKYMQPMSHEFKFVFYGARQTNTRFTLELMCPTVEYGDPYFQMSSLGDLSNTASFGYRWYNQVCSFWQNKARPLTTSAIAGRIYPNLKPVMRVIKKWTYDIHPATTIERDDTPNSRVVNLSIRDGRMLDYAWPTVAGAYNAANTSLTAGIDDLNLNVNRFIPRTTTAAMFDTSPRPLQRWYLVISASNPTPTVSGSATVDVTPSYDMLYRRTELLSDI